MSLCSMNFPQACYACPGTLLVYFFPCLSLGTVFFKYPWARLLPLRTFTHRQDRHSLLQHSDILEWGRQEVRELWTLVQTPWVISSASTSPGSRD